MNRLPKPHSDAEPDAPIRAHRFFLVLLRRTQLVAANRGISLARGSFAEEGLHRQIPVVLVEDAELRVDRAIGPRQELEAQLVRDMGAASGEKAESDEALPKVVDLRDGVSAPPAVGGPVEHPRRLVLRCVTLLARCCRFQHSNLTVRALQQLRR